MSRIWRVLSLGAGVQSSVLALMSAEKEIPRYDFAVFADTQAEPLSVYVWLDWLEKQLPFPVYRVTKGNLGADSIRLRVSQKSGNVYMKNLLPVFIQKTNGGQALMGRRCTADYKVATIQRKLREIVKPPRMCKEVLVHQSIGISTDEAIRMKPSQLAWVRNEWPLIDLGMSRQDCIRWMDDHDMPEPPRSACVFCPFHDDDEWLRLKTEEPEEFQRAVDFDYKMRHVADQQTGTARLQGPIFLHRSGLPLDQVEFSNDDKSAKVRAFGNECEGLCGV